MIRLYFCGGWFDPQQEEEHTRLYDLIKNKFEVFNPRLAGIVSTSDTADRMTNILFGNLKALNECQVVVAITDRKDMGSIWEMGYAYAMKKPIIYYCETLGDKPFNLMLAKTGMVARNEEQLLALLSDEESLKFYESRNDYKGEIE